MPCVDFFLPPPPLLALPIRKFQCRPNWTQSGTNAVLLLSLLGKNCACFEEGKNLFVPFSQSRCANISRATQWNSGNSPEETKTGGGELTRRPSSLGKQKNPLDKTEGGVLLIGFFTENFDHFLTDVWTVNSTKRSSKPHTFCIFVAVLKTYNYTANLLHQNRIPPDIFFCGIISSPSFRELIILFR